MYPNEIIFGLDLYTILLCVAVIAALVIYRSVADFLNIKAKLQNLCIYTAMAAIVCGYLSAVLFQALYNIKKYGRFILDSNTGATFYGGLIGGAAVFLLVYFVVGAKIFKNKEHITGFFDVADVAACSISLAHAIGRIGCLMAGCCHGMRTEKWFGIYMVDLGYKVIPTQLFEAIFLALLCVFFLIWIRSRRTYSLQIYMIAYGAWRFAVEYMRDDYRGTTLVNFLTPSQLTAVLMALGGVALIFLQKKLKQKLEVCNER